MGVRHSAYGSSVIGEREVIPWTTGSGLHRTYYVKDPIRNLKPLGLISKKKKKGKEEEREGEERRKEGREKEKEDIYDSLF
jgi:hypothetical protein